MHILKPDLPKIPMFFAEIIEETLVRSIVKYHDMDEIAGHYGLVGSDRFLFDLVFEARVLEQVGPAADKSELTEFKISSPFRDQFKEQGVLVERVPTMVPQVGEVSITPKILISIMPKFVRKIFAGAKKIELRKRRPKFLHPKDRALVYASAPLQAIVGEMEIDDIVEGTPQEIWERYSEVSGVSKEFFDSYYQGHSAAAGLLIGKTFGYPTKIPLGEIRQARSGFSPPQNYLYLTEGDPLLSLARKLSESLKTNGQPAQLPWLV